MEAVKDGKRPPGSSFELEPRTRAQKRQRLVQAEERAAVRKSFVHSCVARRVKYAVSVHAFNVSAGDERPRGTGPTGQPTAQIVRKERGEREGGASRAARRQTQ